jgi:hypothetical protein
MKNKRKKRGNRRENRRKSIDITSLQKSIYLFWSEFYY